MIRCKELVKAISSDEPLGFRKRAEIKLHLLMCVHCSNYSRHLKILADGVRRLLLDRMRSVSPQDVAKIERESLERLKNKL